MTQGSSARLEQAAHNRQVAGSNPAPATNLSNACILASTIELTYPGVRAHVDDFGRDVILSYRNETYALVVDDALRSERHFRAAMLLALAALEWATPELRARSPMAQGLSPMDPRLAPDAPVEVEVAREADVPRGTVLAACVLIITIAGGMLLLLVAGAIALLRSYPAF